MTEQKNAAISDEEAIIKIAQAMKDNAPVQEEKQNIHTFLFNIVEAIETDKMVKVGNLRDDKELNELGIPAWTLRGALDMARVSDMLMDNPFFKDYFEKQAMDTVASSLSREGFLIRQGTTQTKQVADITRRRKVNKGMFKSKVEESGGDTMQTQK